MSSPIMSGPAPPTTGIPRGILARVDRLEAWLHVTLVLLTAASAVRYLQGHGLGDAAPWVLGGAGACWRCTPAGGGCHGGIDAGGHHVVRGAGGDLVRAGLLAPSFAWCAVPLAFVALRVLPFRRPARWWPPWWSPWPWPGAGCGRCVDPTVLLGPVCVAVLAVVAYRALDRDARLRQRLLDDLREAQGELADTQHRSGRLAERTRLSREIHDTVGSGAVQHQPAAAGRRAGLGPTRRTPPAGTCSRRRRRLATASTRLGGVVRDLADDPSDVGRPVRGPGRDRPAASPAGQPEVEVRVHGDPTPLTPETCDGAAPTARGALANVVEHAGAAPGRRDPHLPGRRGDPRRARRRARLRPRDALPTTGDGVRGLGLSGLRSRIRGLGGQLVVETAPGEGTV